MPHAWVFCLGFGLVVYGPLHLQTPFHLPASSWPATRGNFLLRQSCLTQGRVPASHLPCSTLYDTVILRFGSIGCGMFPRERRACGL